MNSVKFYTENQWEICEDEFWEDEIGSYSSNYSDSNSAIITLDEQIDDGDSLSMSVCYDEQINDMDKGPMSFFTKLLYKSSINNQHTNLTDEDMSLGSQEVDGFVDATMGPEVESYNVTKMETIKPAFYTKIPHCNITKNIFQKKAKLTQVNFTLGKPTH